MDQANLRVVSQYVEYTHRSYPVTGMDYRYALPAIIYAYLMPHTSRQEYLRMESPRYLYQLTVF